MSLYTRIYNERPSKLKSCVGSIFKSQGFTREVISDECTVKDFCRDHTDGVYVLGTGTHAIAVVDGKYCDAWDSGNEQPIYLYKRRDE